MTPRQMEIITGTFPLIREIAIPVSLLFYGRLFDLDPSLRLWTALALAVATIGMTRLETDGTRVCF